MRYTLDTRITRCCLPSVCFNHLRRSGNVQLLFPRRSILTLITDYSGHRPRSRWLPIESRGDQMLDSDAWDCDLFSVFATTLIKFFIYGHVCHGKNWCDYLWLITWPMPHCLLGSARPLSFRLAWFLHRIILSPASYFILSHYQRPNPISTPNYLITWRAPYLMLSHQLLTLHNDPGSFPLWTRPAMPWTYYDHWPRPRRKILNWQSLLSFSSTMGSSRKIFFVVHEGLLLHPKYVVVREISKA